MTGSEGEAIRRRLDRLELKLSQLHAMVRAINQRTRPQWPEPTHESIEPDFAQEYQGEWKTEDDLK